MFISDISSKIITIGKLKWGNYYLKCNNIWIEEQDEDITRLVSIINKSIVRGSISDQDKSQIFMIIEEVEKYAILTKDEVFLEINDLPPTDYEFDDLEDAESQDCNSCGETWVIEDLLVYKNGDTNEYYCRECCDNKFRSNNISKFNSYARGNVKDAFDDDEQYIDWYENQ